MAWYNVQNVCFTNIPYTYHPWQRDDSSFIPSTSFLKILFWQVALLRSPECKLCKKKFSIGILRAGISTPSNSSLPLVQVTVLVYRQDSQKKKKKKKGSVGPQYKNIIWFLESVFFLKKKFCIANTEEKPTIYNSL